MASGRVDVLLRDPFAAAVTAASRVQSFTAVPIPAVRVGIVAKPGNTTATTAILSAGAGDPVPFRVQHLAGASADYSGHPTIPDGSLQADVGRFNEGLLDAISQSGRALAGPHGYSGTSWPSTYSASAVSWAVGAGYSYAFLNVKTGGVSSWQSLADGTGTFTDSFINNFINSVPANVTLVFGVNHEPENDGSQPASDGGTWEIANAPVWCAGIARVANLVAAANRPNVYFCVIHMSDTFPDDGVVSGARGINGRVTSRWNCWAGMTAAAKGRTIFGPDGYTKMREAAVALSGTTSSTFITSSGDATNFTTGTKCILESNTGALVESKLFTVTVKSGTGSNRSLTITPAFTSAPPAGYRLRRFDTLRSEFDGVFGYVVNAGWGVAHVGISEHTINNDVETQDGVTAVVWRDDVKPYLRDLRDGTTFPGLSLAYHLFFNHSTGAASGTNGWVDLPSELYEAGRLAWELNTGEVL